MTADRVKVEIIRKQAARLREKAEGESYNLVSKNDVITFLDLIEDVASAGDGEPEEVAGSIIFGNSAPAITTTSFRYSVGTEEEEDDATEESANI